MTGRHVSLCGFAKQAAGVQRLYRVPNFRHHADTADRRHDGHQLADADGVQLSRHCFLPQLDTRRRRHAGNRLLHQPTENDGLDTLSYLLPSFIFYLRL